MDQVDTKKIIEDDISEERRVLEKTQRIREFIIDTLTDRGTDIPSGRSMDQLIMTLDGFDRQSLSLRKIRAEEKAANNIEANKEIIAGLLKAIDRSPVQTTVYVQREAPSLPDEITVTEFLPGEMRQGTINENFEEFSARRNAERGNPKLIE